FKIMASSTTKYRCIATLSQTLEALPSQPTASGNESHIPGAVSE
ncbi:hypothetical protein Tco_1098479, partial [Tanacetum coccineum]